MTHSWIYARRLRCCHGSIIHITRNVCFFGDIKLKKYFHGNIKACEMLSFRRFSNVSYLIVAGMPKGPFSQICAQLYTAQNI